MNKDTSSYKIMLNERWTLEDLTEFSRLYFQNYSFLYNLEREEKNNLSPRISSVLREYELRDGLSYVNIYDILKSSVPQEDRPKISSMKYNSPGWIELLLDPTTALQVAGAITVYLNSLEKVGNAYKKLYKIYIELSKLRQKKKNESLKLDIENTKLVKKLNKELAEGLDFKNLEGVDAKTKDVEESSKLLMAHYRRIRNLAKFVTSGKANFPTKLPKNNEHDGV